VTAHSHGLLVSRLHLHLQPRCCRARHPARSPAGAPCHLHGHRVQHLKLNIVKTSFINITFEHAHRMLPLLLPGAQSLRPGGGIWTGLQLSSGYCQVAWQSPVLRLSPFRPRLFGDGFRFHRRQR
jgi:hypothetical protein